MKICPASANPCISNALCDDRLLCVRLHAAPIDVLDTPAALHFVGFCGDEYRSAVRVFGAPDFVHRIWDRRAFADVAPGDTVVFARYHDMPPSPYSYDDSAQAHDPATLERRS